MKKLLLLIAISPVVFVQGQTTGKSPETARMTHQMTELWAPVPEVVEPGLIMPDGMIAPPSDAIVLFDGTDLSQWISTPDKAALTPGKDMSMFKSSQGGEARWDIQDGVLVVNKEAGDIQTKLEFNDFQLHIEWRIPEVIHGEGQRRGNSGIFLQGIYELQVLDSYENTTYVNGQAASIYKQAPPLVNAMRKPGEWNTYDIIYMAPTFRKDGSFRTKPLVTVLHNGVLVQNNTVIQGTTPHSGLPQVIPHGKGPIRLQAHGDESEPISFRNIWIREL